VLPVSLGDYASLEDWPREGRPHRNVVAEYPKRSQEAGPEVQAAFCAVLGDMLGMVCTGAVPDAMR
jgi:hypothetical protein